MKMYRVAEAAKLLDMPTKSLYAILREHPHWIKVVKIGRRVRIPISSLEEFIASGGQSKVGATHKRRSAGSEEKHKPHPHRAGGAGN